MSEDGRSGLGAAVGSISAGRGGTPGSPGRRMAGTTAGVGKEEVKGAASAAPGREVEEAAAARPAAARAVLLVILGERERERVGGWGNRLKVCLFYRAQGMGGKCK